MRTISVIGIGAGDPEQITVQAISALNRADVFFVVDKGDEKRTSCCCGRRSATGTCAATRTGWYRSRSRNATARRPPTGRRWSSGGRGGRICRG